MKTAKYKKNSTAYSENLCTNPNSPLSIVYIMTLKPLQTSLRGENGDLRGSLNEDGSHRGDTVLEAHRRANVFGTCYNFFMSHGVFLGFTVFVACLVEMVEALT